MRPDRHLNSASRTTIPNVRTRPSRHAVDLQIELASITRRHKHLVHRQRRLTRIRDRARLVLTRSQTDRTVGGTVTTDHRRVIRQAPARTPPVPAVSPTVCAPIDTSTAPVVPPSPTFAPVPAVTLSICKLNSPASPDGTSTLFTVNVGLRVFVIVHVLS